MKVFSKSKGAFIDTEAFQSGMIPGGTGEMGGDKFQRAALMDLITNEGKNLSKINTLKSFYPDTTKNKAAATSLRKEFAAETKKLGYQELKNSWSKVANASPDASGDLTIIYSYVKALDPNSVVREGEINLTKAAESVTGNVIRAWKRAKEGAVMSPKLRQQMVTEVGNIYNERAREQQKLNAFYSGLASDSGLDPNDVIGNIGEITLAEVPKNREIKQDKSIGGILGGVLGGAGGFMVGGPIGAGAGAVAGYGAGGAMQESLQDLLGLQTEQPMEQLKKVAGGAVGAGGKALTAASLFNLLQGAGTFLKGGGLKGLRTAEAIKAGKEGVKIDGEKIAQAALDAAEEAPVTYRPTARRIALEAIDKFAGKQISPLGAVGEKARAWDAGYTATKAGKGASAFMERAIGSEIKNQIAGKAKGISDIDKIYSTLFKGKELAKSGLWNAIKVSGLGRLLGF